MKNQQGTLTRVIDHINRIWPFKRQTILIEDNIEDNKIIVIGNPDFTFQVDIGGKILVTQPIVICAVRYVILTITWDFSKENSISVYLYGVHIDSIKKNKEKIVIATPPSSGILSLNNGLEEYDKKWEEWRSKLFLREMVNVRPKKDVRKEKSISEQFDELEVAINSLKSNLIENCYNEKLFLYQVLPILRALVFWKGKMGTYNPLLFRLAGCINHKLVIYALSKEIRSSLERRQGSNTVFSYFDNVTLGKQSSTQVLIDFQEWLCTGVITGSDVLTYKDVIEKASNTMSFTHFDPDIPLVIEDLKNRLFLSTSMLFDIIKMISKIVLDLGSSLIKEYSKQNNRQENDRETKKK